MTFNEYTELSLEDLAGFATDLSTSAKNAASTVSASEGDFDELAGSVAFGGLSSGFATVSVEPISKPN